MYWHDSVRAVRFRAAVDTSPGPTGAGVIEGCVDDAGTGDPLPANEQDREGRNLHAAGRKRYIVTVDQLPEESVFHVYRREGEAGRPHDHSRVLLSFKGGADGTDGRDVTSAPLGPDFPDRMMVAMNSASRNFLMFRRRDIASVATPALHSASRLPATL